MTQREKEKQRRRRVRRYLCLADEHRGRKKIIVDKKCQPSKKWNDKYSFLKGEKYQSKPISQKREERKDTRRLKDTTRDLSVYTLHTFKKVA